MSTNETVIIKHDRIHCLVPNLFRSQPKGVKRKSLDVDYDYNDNTKIMIRGFESLGADDLLYLQGILALCVNKGRLRRQPRRSTSDTDRLWDTLKPKEEAINQEFLSVTFKIETLLSIVGLSTGKKNRDNLKRSLIRMSNVSFIFEQKKPKRIWGSSILGFSVCEKEITVALDLAITEAVCGGIYTVIPIEEVRQIKHAPAKLLHQRFCAIIDPGSNCSFFIDKLIRYVYGDDAEQTPSRQVMNKRRETVKKALNELSEIGWTISENDGVFSVTRPDLPELP